MRHSLACNVCLRHFGVWRAGIGAVAILSAASLLAWIVAGRDLWAPASMAAAAVAVVMVAALAASLLRVETGTLRFEQGVWTFVPALGVGAEPEVGRLHVALDLGAFMLLSFRPTRSGPVAARRWLPAQRQGHEQEWHALRCAVYSPRPVEAGSRPASAAAPE